MAPRVSEARALLCVVLDASAFGPEPGSFARTLFRAGVDWIQLRDRTIEGRDFLAWALAVVEAAHDAEGAQSPLVTKRRVLINRRIDVAWAAGADGAHLGFDAPAPEEARRLLPEGALVGGSFHSPDEVEAASANPTRHDYVHLAPIWAPNSKPASRPALGPERLARACRSGIPVLAQGGIDPDRARRAIHAGAAGVAVTGAIRSDAEPEPGIRRLRKALDGQN